MKKTITALALTASSSSAFALMAPAQATKKICLSVYENDNGVMVAGTCDESRNNKERRLPLLENGCAENQISLTSRKYAGQFDISIRSCLPPNVVQL